MAIRTRTTGEMNQLSIEFLLRNSDITLLTPGSAARALLETNNRHIEGFYDSLTVNMASAHLTTARGAYIDVIAQMFGMRRLQPRQAFTTPVDRAIRFYVSQGSLVTHLPDPANLNQGKVPSGVQVTNDDGTVIYTVDQEVYFPRTATEVFVSATCSSIGEVGNVGAFVLTKHSLPNASIQVSNPTTITTGTSTESDSEFRTRISNYILATEGANRTAVRLAALSAPGVADVRIIPWLMGAGSFDVLLIPVGNRIASEAVLVAKRGIEEVVAFGMAFRIREPDYVRFSMVIRAQYTSDTLTAGQTEVRGTVERAVLDYMGNVRMGQEMVVTELGAAIRNADQRIYDYKIEAMCFNGKLLLPHNFRLMDDELFIPDEQLVDPVRVI